VLFADRGHYKAHRLISVDRDQVSSLPGRCRNGSGWRTGSRSNPGRVVAKEENSGGRTRVVPLSGKRARIRLLASRMRVLAARLVRALPILRRRGERGRLPAGRSSEQGLLSWFCCCSFGRRSVSVSCVDSATSVGQHVAAGTTTVTVPHTTAAGSNLILVVGISMNITNNTGATVSG